MNNSIACTLPKEMNPDPRRSHIPHSLQLAGGAAEVHLASTRPTPVPPPSKNPSPTMCHAIDEDKAPTRLGLTMHRISFTIDGVSLVCAVHRWRMGHDAYKGNCRKRVGDKTGCCGLTRTAGVLCWAFGLPFSVLYIARKRVDLKKVTCVESGASLHTRTG